MDTLCTIARYVEYPSGLKTMDESKNIKYLAVCQTIFNAQCPRRFYQVSNVLLPGLSRVVAFTLSELQWQERVVAPSSHKQTEHDVSSQIRPSPPRYKLNDIPLPFSHYAFFIVSASPTLRCYNHASRPSRSVSFFPSSCYT